jgi:hypothetical protein
MHRRLALLARINWGGFEPHNAGAFNTSFSEMARGYELGIGVKYLVKQVGVSPAQSLKFLA